MAICPKCGLPEELCVCREIKTTEGIKVSFDRRKYRKVVTIIEGVDKENIENTAREIKRRIGCGGTIREGNLIELQGNHKSKIEDVLVKIGFLKETIDVGALPKAPPRRAFAPRRY
ncbi:MAG: stress response translation initiation inhibitor YciH [Candidatus Altiarchaeum hamiconexum]|uniref:Stress response translation initiation inhibitor YciH n=1 Tax=Candidatus Altarchaeum hamiconexum TaxID=1803513 RepID=A0A8J7YWN1_9ARCH|nr:stress response translation initiation inhibitor YciH [Candidatus Altarchaeum hamiconexum]OIQ04643.1 MAG: hypothetical protein AUK59_06975 [Candidatus Altarchaeum sp. CG2_30_32_3053]PIN67179.1 MAG: stress response translation initiation inhibitor YciH [Candidatus Altarchaeum sp. CG12_big_fil_rev_8_21_14_0_65_33_22]PIV28230.1 MAG: stress response translation initiation inhibitor YciH [Candidatus Altarchaeum sp. CG03_land_8_20_14_0_80_32_618]PIX48666.1 MAG: stress response translation initiati